LLGGCGLEESPQGALLCVCILMEVAMRFIGKEKADKLLDVKSIEERAKSEEKLDLEKGDLPAILMAAFFTFAPFILIFAGITFGLWWLFVGRL
jgi:hypothetical protein